MLKPKISDLYTLEQGSDRDAKLVISATPIGMSIMVPKAEDGTYSVIARLTWLCKEMKGGLFCLTTTYAAETETEEEFLVTCPLSNENYFIHNSQTMDILMSSLDHYLTDLNFTFSKPNNMESEDNVIYCQAFEKAFDGNECNDKLYKIKFLTDVYASMAFVDDYMMSSIHSTANLYSALVCGANEASNTKTYELLDLKIGKAATVRNKRFSNKILAVNLRITNDNEETPIELIIIVELDKKVKIVNKFIKNRTLGDLKIDYKDDNQYIDKFAFESNIGHGEVKYDYTFIRAINSKGEGLLVAINNDVMGTIKECILKQIAN